MARNIASAKLSWDLGLARLQGLPAADGRDLPSSLTLPAVGTTFMNPLILEVVPRSAEVLGFPSGIELRRASVVIVRS